MSTETTIVDLELTRAEADALIDVASAVFHLGSGDAKILELLRKHRDLIATVGGALLTELYDHDPEFTFDCPICGAEISL